MSTAETLQQLNEEYRAGRRVTLVGVAVNIFLLVFKLGVGFTARSQALVADGLHTLSDLFSDAVVLIGLRWGRKKEDRRHPYGHARIETLSAMFVGLILVGGALWISVAGIGDLIRGTHSRPSGAALVAALVSIALKEVLYRYTVRTGKRISSQVLIGNAWHHRSDALSSVAVALGVGAGVVSPRLAVLDIYAALAVSLLMIKVGVEIALDAGKEVVDTAPPQEVMNVIRGCALSVEGVKNTHDIKARTSGGRIFMDIHIEVDPRLTVEEGHALAKRVEFCIKDRVRTVTGVAIHVDPHYEQEDSTD